MKLFQVGEIWNTTMSHHRKCLILEVSPDGAWVCEFQSLSNNETYGKAHVGWNSTFTTRDEFLTAIHRRRHPDVQGE